MSGDPRTAWGDYAAELSDIRGDNPELPDPSEIASTTPARGRGDWRCGCGLPVLHREECAT